MARQPGTSRLFDGPLAWQGRRMQNQAMARKLLEGDCLDVRQHGKPAQCPIELARSVNASAGANVFELRAFVDDVDYCDPLLENWIWSIGRQESTGKVFAATDARYYQADGFECLFLR